MTPDIRKRFGRAIRRLREQQKMSQKEAAERCGAFQSTALFALMGHWASPHLLQRS